MIKIGSVILPEVKYLTREEQSLFVREAREKDAKGRPTERAKEAQLRLFASFADLIMRLANEMRIDYDQRDEVLQEAFPGFLKALERFDETLGIKFITFAYNFFRKALQEWIVKCYSIKVPCNLSVEMVRLEERGVETGVDFLRPQWADIKKILETSKFSVETIIAGNKSRRLSTVEDMTHYGKKDGDIEEIFGGDGDHTQKTALREISSDLIFKGLEERTPREREIIILYLGLNGGPSRTLREVGLSLGMTRQNATYIYNRAIVKLIAFIKEIVPTEYPYLSSFWAQGH